MGTRAKCIKCGAQKWINTGKLHRIRTELGIKPSEWLKTRYMCSDCKKRINLIQESTIESVAEKMNQFSLECKQAFSGFFSGKHNEAVSKLKQRLQKEGIIKYGFIKYRNVIVAIEMEIPVIGKFMVSLMV